MSNVTIRLDIKRLEGIQRNLPELAGRAIASLAFEGEGYIKKNMGASPSAPGEFPGVDTGKLRNSIRAEKEATLRWVVTTDTEYAAHLEFGTSRMAPRPFMSPTLDYLSQIAPDWFAGFLELSR